MRPTVRFALLLFLSLLLTPLATFAQETEPPEGARISTVQLSGIEARWLSPGLQEAIDKLAGTPLNRQALRDLAARIEGEQPRYITAVRTVQEPDGSARVTFVAARIREPGRDTDINSKYIVSHVELRGMAERDLSPDLQKDLQALADKPFDSDAADQIATRLRSEFPGYQVERRMSRGGQRGRVTVIFILRVPEWARLLRFEPFDGNALFHSDQGWGAVLPLVASSDDLLISPVIAWDNADTLIEEYSGFALRFESRRLGSERVGMFFEWATFDQEWRDATLAALPFNPQVPALYRNRMSVTPLLKFAFTPQVTIAGGVGITELDPLIEDVPLPSQMANVAIGSVRYKQQWGESSKPAHEAGATFTVRAATTGLESDFTYERYLGEADYRFRRGKHSVLLSGMAGGISGAAPLFERFSLGDTRTLRGWDKYDISPVGGDRMFHTSAEYRIHAVSLFLDAGAVWDTGTQKKVRFSTGASFSPGPVFFTLGFPINTDEFRAVFAMGFRFGISSTGVRKN